VIVDDGVFVSAYAIFCRDLIGLDLIRRQNDTCPHVALVMVRRVVLSYNILMKSGSGVDAKYAGDTAGHPTDDPTNGRSDGAARRITGGRALRGTTWDTLRLRRANPERDENRRYRYCVF
jgi:hypothetical protein